MGLKNNNTVVSALKLALSKKSLNLKIKYLLLAIIFIPLILWENKGGPVNSNSASSQSLTGDDIYPLF
jgi:hypothetical protein